MAWVRPSRSRQNGPRPRWPGPGQEGGVAGNSGGAGGSSLPAGGSAALGGGDTGLGRSRGARAPRDQCHQLSQIVPGSGYRSGFSPLLLAPLGEVAPCCRPERPSPIKSSSARRKGSWLPSAPARTISISRSARAMVGARRGWREPAKRRRSGWLHRQGRSNGLESGRGGFPWPCVG